MIYKVKYTISELLLNNPILGSDLIDRMYIVASREPGLSLWKYDANRTTGIQIQVGYENGVNLDITNSLLSTMSTYCEGLVRDPANYGLLMQLGIAGDIDTMDQNTLRSCIVNAITVLDISAKDKTAFLLKIG